MMMMMIESEKIWSSLFVVLVKCVFVCVYEASARKLNNTSNGKNFSQPNTDYVASDVDDDEGLKFQVNGILSHLFSVNPALIIVIFITHHHNIWVVAVMLSSKQTWIKIVKHKQHILDVKSQIEGFRHVYLLEVVFLLLGVSRICVWRLLSLLQVVIRIRLLSN